MATAEASFSISILSMLELLIPSALLTGKPSTTYNGSLFPTIEFVPLTRILIGPPGAPLFCFTCTPDALPASACITLADANALISSLVTEEIDPVTSDFLTDPYPITTTSFRDDASPDRVTLIVVLVLTGISCEVKPIKLKTRIRSLDRKSTR